MNFNLMPHCGRVAAVSGPAPPGMHSFACDSAKHEP